MELKALKNQSISEDINLVKRLLEGEESSFEELVYRYYRPIVSYIRKMVDDHEVALDLAQEVFIKVYNSAWQYSSEYRFSTWIYKIAHNTTVDYLRKRSNLERSLEVEEESHGTGFKSNSLSPEEESLNKEKMEQIENLIKCLPSNYRELIILRHNYELSYEEIAQITGLPLGTVKNRLFRAREMMKDMLSRRGLI